MKKTKKLVPKAALILVAVGGIAVAAELSLNVLTGGTTVQMPDDETAELVSVSAVVKDQNGFLVVDDVYVVTEQAEGGRRSSASFMDPDLSGAIDGRAMIREFNTIRPLKISVWSNTAGAFQPHRNDFFLDDTDGAAVFITQAATSVPAGGYEVDLGEVQASLPDDVGQVTLLQASLEDLLVHIEDPSRGSAPNSALISVAGTLPAGQTSFSLYSWNRINSWRVALYSPTMGLVGSATLLRGSTVQIDITTVGGVEGSINSAVYPDSVVVMAIDPNAPVATHPDPIIELTWQFEDYEVTPSSIVYSDDTYSIGSLAPGTYDLELWDDIDSGDPLATKSATVVGGSTTTVDFP